MATKKQLDALARGRATAAKNRAAGKKPPTRKTPRKVVRGNPVRPLTSHVSTGHKKKASPKVTQYAIRIVTTKGEEGWLSGWDRNGPEVDTEHKKAMTCHTLKMATVLAYALHCSKPRGIKSVEPVIFAHQPVKKN